MPLTISQLHVYPVKSLRGISLAESDLQLAGLAHDRQWMLVDSKGAMMTQRSHPQMALVDTSLDDGVLVLDTFGMDTHRVPVTDAAMARRSSSVWGSAVSGIDVGDETADWLGQAIGEECRLIAFPASDTRPCDPEYSNPGDHTRYADGFPLLVVTQASLDYLNERLATPVSINRFRPNIVIDGANAHDEDDWRTLRIGDISMRLVKACARCSVPTVDPESGVLAGPEPIHTLSSYRRRDGEVFFGINASPDGEGRLAVGDTVSILD